MNDVNVSNALSAVPVRDEAKVTAFAAGQRGPVLRPGDSGYDQARSIWNGMIDKRPALIAQCTGTADVIDAVNFAREHDLLLSVRGGGHNIAGTAVCDGGLMIDLSGMKGIHLDLGEGIARVQPGCNWGDVDREGQAFGLSVPAGIVSTTGVSGLTLGGGFGWLTRSYGYTSDNLVEVDMVTADGAFVRASESENADLFWGVRGGGGNFGIVTSFAFRLRPIGPRLVAGMVLHPMQKAEALIDLYREVTAAAPDQLCCLLILRLAPPLPVLPEEVHGRPVAGIAVCYNGPIDEGLEAVRPIKGFGTPLADLIGPKPFVAHQTMFDAGQPFGRQYYWKSDYFDALEPAAARTLIGQAERITSPHSALLFMHLGGAAKRIPTDGSALAYRHAEHVFNVQSAWTDPAEPDVHIAWARETWRAMSPFSTGAGYVNFMTEDEGEERVRAAYGPQIYDRLAALKAKHDPGNLFRLTQNIRPKA
jgi:FAD/FMN-containing dehydrogenase